MVQTSLFNQDIGFSKSSNSLITVRTFLALKSKVDNEKHGSKIAKKSKELFLKIKT